LEFAKFRAQPKIGNQISVIDWIERGIITPRIREMHFPDAGGDNFLFRLARDRDIDGRKLRMFSMIAPQLESRFAVRS
jgi:hypothetical protein